MHEKPEILSPTEARQASRKKTNFRVLVTSLVILLVIGAVLYLAFYNTQDVALPPTPTP